jgi:SNF2 family DNA or RNA helicase
LHVLKDKKALIFKLREPSRITTVVPTAKVVVHQGQQLVAVPHRPDETRVLRRLGFKDVPDPMPIYYDWPGKKPFDAQRETANFLAMQSRCFVLNSMGTGKTISTLWAYDYLRGAKQIHRAIVVCPLSTMERVWADEVFKNFPHLETVVLHGTAERRKKLLAQNADIYIINPDGLKIIKEDLAKRPDIDLVILDEVAIYRNGSTERWKAADAICNKQSARRVWALTGSPIPNAPTDAWGQCRLVVPANGNVPKYFGKFRDAVMKQITQFKWIPREDALETVRQAMSPSIRFSLDDMLDLPEQMFTTRDVELTAEQKKAYKEMMAKLKTEYEGGQVLAVNEAVKANKLLQIALGAAYTTNSDAVILPTRPRVEVVEEIIEESEGKVIVFVPFTVALENLAKDLRKDLFNDDEYAVAVVHGETKKNERDEIFGAFQNHEYPRVIVANPGTMSHGLTLTSATTIVWYGPTHSGETYEQANARVRRPGQKRTTVIAHIAATDVERRIYERLKNKQKVQGVLLDMFKEQEVETV